MTDDFQVPSLYVKAFPIVDIFNISDDHSFEAACLQTFAYQFEHVPVYHEFCRLLGVKQSEVTRWQDIPFLPIEVFRTHEVMVSGKEPEIIFESSGTTSDQRSRHLVADANIYKQSLEKTFRLMVTDPQSAHIFALLPSYLDRQGSSLVYMIEDLLRCNPKQMGGFYNRELDKLSSDLRAISANDGPIILIGVSFALMDLAEQFPQDLSHVTLIETGGMKGRGPELTREELQGMICAGLKPKKIISEYGMTELLSQAWMKDDGLFHSPPWMRVVTRDITEPLNTVSGTTGCINVIDLANRYSCSFIATADIGKVHSDGSFEVLGRLDNSDIRGCNLLYTIE